MARWNAPRSRAAGPIAAIALLIHCGAAGVARCQPYPNEGFVGVYFDRAGTQSCGSAPLNTVTELYVLATLLGSTQDGITGAEFRLEVTPATSYLFILFRPIECAPCLYIQDPLDRTCANDAAGLNVAFPDCRASDPIAGSGRVFLGTIEVFSLGGPLSILTKARTPASNSDFRCPLFVRCDAPVYTMVCTTLQDGDPSLGGSEPISFRSVLNGNGCVGPAECVRVGVEARPWSLVKTLYRDAGR